ncbi:iron-only hydrogenase maturation protein HydF [Roseiarcus fermentans]|uniref:Iron-only hydrogenase maturation protein HydF n=1 Tax=Roseiarcus fermentans TaxID=1473586 RepID=A0A366EEM7_9HYPH|nr:[FeFe] hydrogenase H-cluster maturation GTPase HydF [Roseiarcus fermentans]RBP00864.1 iron-only hydrogenase maturation protein HydF [Roseiarcus fermentans]
MLDTPKSLRMHIGLFGRRNVGKSSLMNALLGFPMSIVSEVAGTTTDPVEKAIEMPPLGPVVLVDTAGVDDVGDLGALRSAKTREVLERVDIALVLSDETGLGPFERELIARLRARETPTLCVFNKSDLGGPSLDEARALVADAGEAVAVSVTTGRNLDGLRESLIRLAPEERILEPPLVADLVPAGGLVVLVVPIDLGAPKGRLIPPQVQAIRETLDADATCLVVKERELTGALDMSGQAPSLVICDSQIVLKAAADTPPDIPLTTFSILMARLKADLVRLAEGAAVLHRLRPGDRVLVAEACTHGLICDDIGRVKIPRWLRQFAGGDLRIDFSGGKHFPEDVSQYRLIIQCGACMVTRRHMLSWLYRAERQGVPMTNYGLAISVVQGVLERSLEPFPEALSAYEAARRKALAEAL